jgi:hypothetical protein
VLLRDREALGEVAPRRLLVDQLQPALRHPERADRVAPGVDREHQLPVVRDLHRTLGVEHRAAARRNVACRLRLATAGPARRDPLALQKLSVREAVEGDDAVGGNLVGLGVDRSDHSPVAGVRGGYARPERSGDQTEHHEPPQTVPSGAAYVCEHLSLLSLYSLERP